MIGTRGHDIGGLMTPEALAQGLDDQGFKAVQLVAYRSIKGIGEGLGQINEPMATRIGKALEDKDIQVSLIGSYFNMLHPDPNVKDEGIQRFKEYLHHAKALGGRLVGTETGSYDENYQYHEDNSSQKAIDQVIEVVKELVKEAEIHDVQVGIEGVWSHSVNTPERMKYLLDQVDCDRVSVIFDPVNYLTVDNHESAKAIMAQSFELFGHRIEIIHAKDYRVEGDALVEVPLGEGLLDYPYLVACQREYCPKVPVIIEGLSGEDLVKSKNFLAELKV